MNYRIKLAVFALSGVILLFVLDTAHEALNTLRRLDVVEAERDQWQRPSDVIGALNLKPGSTVVDLGCGSGYFALKLSSAVDSGGTVYAVDIRRLPLIFLWIRTLIKHQRNIRTVLGETIPTFLLALPTLYSLRIPITTWQIQVQSWIRSSSLSFPAGDW